MPYLCFFVQKKFLSKFSNNEKILTEDLLVTLPTSKLPNTIHVRDNDVAVVFLLLGAPALRKVLCNSRQPNVLTLNQLSSISNSLPRIVSVPHFLFLLLWGVIVTHSSPNRRKYVIANHIFLGGVIRDIIFFFFCTGFAGVPSTYQILINKTPFKRGFAHTSIHDAGWRAALPNKYIR
jgi:hypothetical protein